MRLILLTLIVLCCGMVQAQDIVNISGVVKDNQTGETIVGAVIKAGDKGTTTDADGKFSLDVDKGQRILVSGLGYAEQYVKATGTENNMDIELSRNYMTLSDVQITTKKFSIDSLFIKAANNVPNNYLSSDHGLRVLMNVQLYKPADTAVNYSKILLMHNNNAEWYNYYVYGIKDDTGSGKFKVSFKMFRNYMPPVRPMHEKDLAKWLMRFVGTGDKLQYVLSSFTDNGDKYYDLIFINPERKVKYTLIGKAMGYTDNRNENVARRYISLTEFYFNARTFAVPFERSIMIECTDKDKDAFVKMKNRNDMEAWITNAIAEKRKFFTYNLVFNQWKDKYYLQHIYYKDNLIYPLLKSVPLENYTYKVSYDVNSVGIQLPDNVKKIDPYFYLSMKAD